MCLTATMALRCALVTLTRITTTLLWRRLLARAGRITTSFDALPHRLAKVLEVFEGLVNDVSP